MVNPVLVQHPHQLNHLHREISDSVLAKGSIAILIHEVAQGLPLWLLDQKVVAATLFEAIYERWHVWNVPQLQQDVTFLDPPCSRRSHRSV